jgi:hypothetical protein
MRRELRPKNNPGFLPFSPSPIVYPWCPAAKEKTALLAKMPRGDCRPQRLAAESARSFESEKSNLRQIGIGSDDVARKSIGHFAPGFGIGTQTSVA